MKNALNMLSLATLVLFNLNLAHAEASKPYDTCEGSFVTGGFSSERKTFVVTAHSEGSISVHLNGTTTDYFFEGNLETDGIDRMYSGVERFGDGHSAKLNINCSSVDDKACPAELITDLSGNAENYNVRCFLDRVDYSAPTNPPQCTPHHCR